MYYVYSLVDPINNVPFYIGKGTGDRMYTHLYTKRKADTCNKDKVRYIKNIRMLGHEPLAIKIDDKIESEKEAFALESYCIKQAIRIGFPLTNKIYNQLFMPSRLGTKVSKEIIEKRTKTLKENIKSGKTARKKISAEQKKIISEANRGKEGLCKVYLDTSVLKDLYLNQNKTKKEILDHFKIGMGSLNRILSENKIYKIKH
jgi:hypothetical protein